MKRALLVFALLFTVFSTVSAKEDLFSFSVGPQSGLIFYGDSNIKAGKNSLSGSHFIFGALAEVNINPYKELTFFAGADALCDIVSGNGYHSNHFSLDFPLGIKIYPGLGGFCTGLAYTFGYRYGNILLPDETVDASSAWGNGCRFLFEYNFAHDNNSRFLPTIGISWKYIPRGNYFIDNMITAYVLINL